MADLINFPTQIKGRATLIIPRVDAGPEFEARLRFAMAALFNVNDVTVEEDGIFSNKSGEPVTMYHFETVEWVQTKPDWIAEQIATGGAREVGCAVSNEEVDRPTTTAREIQKDVSAMVRRLVGIEDAVSGLASDHNHIQGRVGGVFSAIKTLRDKANGALDNVSDPK